MPIANDLGAVPPLDEMPVHVWPWPSGCMPAEAWRRWASDTDAWLKESGVDPRQAWVVVPVGAVLSHARSAWSEAVGGWLPRIDTIAGLVDALGWSQAAPPWRGPLADAFAGPVTLDAVLDRLQARRSLGMQAWAKQWAQRDPRGFDFAMGQVVDAAQTWLRALQACAPSERAERVAAWRLALPEATGAGHAQGPGHREALLLAWALEWAAASGLQGFASDVVFAGPADGGAAAWVLVQAGVTVAPGSEGALTLAAAAHAARQGVPVRRVVAQAVEDGAVQAVGWLACADSLDEARQAAAATVAAINAVRDAGTADGQAGRAVALIALDRGVVRHARALLEEVGVSLADETGWRLSTTRAASVCSRLLAAANPRASTDELLDWLKSGWLRRDAEVTLDDAVGLLEAWCRRHGLVNAWGLGAHMGTGTNTTAIGQSLPPEAADLWRWAQLAVAPLQSVWQDRRANLADWLVVLHQALAACGAKDALLADEAGQLAWEALRFDDDLIGGLPDGTEASPARLGWQAAARQTRMDGAAMQRWVREVMEDVTFRPSAPNTSPDVVVTTLARAVLRPFAAVVMPGADERQLGALPTNTGWLSQRMREAMGLSTAVQLRQAQWEALQLVLTQPGVTCLYRRAEGNEPRELSPWLARWAQGQADRLVRNDDPRPVQAVAPRPVARPLPTLAGMPVGLPERVSATTYDQLRQCPYRFFATTVLGLRQTDELEEGVEASEYGTWLHEVLHRFHQARQLTLAISRADEDVAQWLAVAREVATDLGMDRDGLRAHFLPFAAALPSLAESYVKWLRAHEVDGWCVRSTEQTLSRVLPLPDGGTVQMHGQLDRIDVRHERPAGDVGRDVRWVLDYKTGNADTLRQRAQSGSEDTQLAFYAALGADPASSDDDAIRAGYVHLDPKGVKVLSHDAVADSAEVLMQGLASDWQRLRDGSPLPALGEGAVCGYCHARGLCRRDHWAAASSPSEGASA
jgi:ATP-dependent helicase/nuclease subunit B